MASVKSLTRSHSQAHYHNHYKQKVHTLEKSHSSAGTTLHQTGNFWLNRNTFISSIDSAQRRLSSVCQILPFLTPITTSSSIFDCYCNNLDNLPLTSSVDCLKNMEKTMPSLHSDPVSASTGMPEQQAYYPDKDVELPPHSHHHSVVDNEYNILCPSVNNSNKISATVKSFQDNTSHLEQKGSVTSSSVEESKMPPGCSYENVAFRDDCISKESAMKNSPSCGCLTSNTKQQKDSLTGAAESKNYKFDTDVDNNTLGLTLKPIHNLALVLSAPRKIVRKGRPSSKKQKKRKREKSKRESSPLSTKDVLSATEVNGKLNQCHSDSESFEFAGSLSHEINHIVHSSRTLSSEFKKNHDKQSASVTPTSGFCPTACLLFRRKSSSEEVDDDDDEWSVNDHNTACISPIDGYGFNFALSLDSIFKKANTPKSVLNAKRNGLSALGAKNSGNQNVRESLCKSDSYDDSDVEICASPVSTEFSDNDYVTHLSEDFLSHTKNQTAANLLVNAAVLNDSFNSPADSDNTQTYGLDTDFETLERINAQWNDYYPTDCLLSCSPKDDAMRGSSVKVHFAAEPELLTVHHLEEEERTSPWQHFALDRERFERRILDLERIISPVLDADHRIKIQEHKLYSDKQ
jgi:hypothetical protein